MQECIHNVVIRKLGSDCTYNKLPELLRFGTSLTISSLSLETGGTKQSGFSSSQTAWTQLFIVHRTIQVLIWGRMTSCEAHRLDRLSVRFCFNIRALGSQTLVLHVIESIDIKLLGFKIKCVCVCARARS